MSNTRIELKIQPARSYNQKKRLAKRLRILGASEERIASVCWSREASPVKGRQL